ncbi:MAG TPA: TonB family protein, partial [Telluria sp.]|nr:TonB family protein [Telluria sp.]
SAGDLASRARDMARGIDLLRSVPPAARPADDAQAARRRVVSTGAEGDVPLRMYIDSFKQKIERNAALIGAQLGVARVRIDPLVSVALRSDGSVEEVTILRSSGRADTDEAVRRIVRLNARYSAFPPNVAARYDVIEIRRIWSFAESLKLLEELR